MMLLGINNGSDVSDGIAPVIDRDNWIADFRMQPIVCEEQGDLELIVDGYEPPTDKYPPVRAVKIQLIRKHNRSLIWQAVTHSHHLAGIPQLKWAQ